MEPAALARLIEDLAGTPERVKALMARVPPERESARPRPDAFSARENPSASMSRRCTPGDLGRAGFWTGVGPVTLERLLEMWRDHDAGHVDEIAFLAGERAAEPKHGF